jgi:hypothetical protein
MNDKDAHTRSSIWCYDIHYHNLQAAYFKISYIQTKIHVLQYY